MYFSSSPFSGLTRGGWLKGGFIELATPSSSLLKGYQSYDPSHAVLHIVNRQEQSVLYDFLMQSLIKGISIVFVFACIKCFKYLQKKSPKSTLMWS